MEVALVTTELFKRHTKLQSNHHYHHTKVDFIGCTPSCHPINARHWKQCIGLRLVYKEHHYQLASFVIICEIYIYRHYTLVACMSVFFSENFVHLPSVHWTIYSWITCDCAYFATHISNYFPLQISKTVCTALQKWNVPANWNGHIEDGYCSCACVVCKQICYDCWSYCRVACLANANNRPQ